MLEELTQNTNIIISALQGLYLTVGSHHAVGVVRWRLCVWRGLRARRSL